MSMTKQPQLKTKEIKAKMTEILKHMTYRIDGYISTDKQVQNEVDQLYSLFTSERDSTIEEIKVGDLRLWLNEDRITDPKKMVTNEQIETMLGLAHLKLGCPAVDMDYNKTMFDCDCGLDDNKSSQSVDIKSADVNQTLAFIAEELEKKLDEITDKYYPREHKYVEGYQDCAVFVDELISKLQAGEEL